MTAGPPVVCTGRALDVDNRPTGEPCGTSGRMSTLDVLRARGWKIGPAGADGTRPAMCPRCARDPELVRLCAALARPADGRPEPAPAATLETLPGL